MNMITVIDSEVLADYRREFTDNLQSGMGSESVRSPFLVNTERNIDNNDSWIHPDEPLRMYEKKYGGGILLSTQPYTMYSRKGHFYVTKEGLDLEELVEDLANFGLSNQGVYKTARSFLYASDPNLNEILSIDSVEDMITGEKLKRDIKDTYLEIHCFSDEGNDDLFAKTYLEKFRDQGYTVEIK